MAKNNKGMSRRNSRDVSPNPYTRVPKRRPRDITFAAGPSVGIQVLGTEVCQTIQDLNNSVSLIARKATIVRVYLDHKSVTLSSTLRGELIYRRSENGPATYLHSLNEIRLNPNEPIKIDDQRENLERALYFRLPSEATVSGLLFIELSRLIQSTGDDQPLSGNETVKVEFKSAPPLRVRCIGLRYRDRNTDVTHTPNSTHFAYMKSFLKRAYPAPEVEWSQIVINANFEAPFIGSTPTLSNAQIAAVRSSEINVGMDPRTHYYGLVDDANGQHFMRGLASGIPQIAQPDTVASGPCGTPNGFAGDIDLSYADWYGAHELGHTFGRFHPGFPAGQQDASDPDFPYDRGQLTSSDKRYVGYDLGDETLNLPMKALPGTTHHDVMTYADNQWLSNHTFEAIRLRLLDEDTEFAPAIG